MVRVGVFLATLLAAISSFGQFSVTDPIPSSQPFDFHYLFPVHPGQPGFLAGTMGELRSTHFHAGIDIRTNNMAGVPILASKNGYISRVLVSSFGYGRALFIAHPNGHTTVYAHLEKFKEPLGDYVRQTQYQKELFEIDLDLPPNQFPIQEGDTIGYSGNTGGSNGPHLHFEIRDSSNEALNPLAFGFDEIKDTYPPVAQKIALKTLDINSRINDRFGRFEFYLYKTGNSYVFPKPILAYGRIGVEILAYDKMDHSGFRCGINQIEMLADSQRVFSQVIDKVNFTESRSIQALMDYQTLKTRGARFNKLYVDDGSRLDYHEAWAHGEIRVDQKDVPVKIVLFDAYGNSSQVKFTLKQNPVVAEAIFLEPLAKPMDFDIYENTLAISVIPCREQMSDLVTLFTKGERLEVKPAYQNPYRKVYLLDLRKMVPDSIRTCRGPLPFYCQDVIPSGTDYKYYSDLADIKFQPESLFDTLFLNVSKTEKDSTEIFSIGRKTIPLNTSIDITLKPLKPHAVDGKALVYRINDGYTCLGGEWKNGRIRFRAQELGDFAILRDSVAPSIVRIQLNRSSARFRIRDQLSGISHFEATIDGSWILMTYDYKTGILQSEKLDKTKPLKGDFQLKVVDNAGNQRIFNQKIL